jgi:hypothetical protein
MRTIEFLQTTAIRLQQLKPVAAAVALAILLSGCVVYGGGGWHPHPYYWR